MRQRSQPELCCSQPPPQPKQPSIYADANYRGWLGSFSQAMTTHHNMSTNANDALTSFRNYTPYSAAFWHDSNRAGRCFSAAPGDVNSGLGFWDNDKVSSFQLGRAC